jgi:hypothetical protein
MAMTIARKATTPTQPQATSRGILLLRYRLRRRPKIRYSSTMPPKDL